jgi:hypothetical protein
MAVAFFSLVLSLAAQTASSGAASSQVPPLIQFSNIATDEDGNTLNGAVSITFSLFSNQRGGDPIWTETQNNVQVDSTGHYSVQLGFTTPSGVPATLFATGETRWLGVRIGEQTEQPRVLLVSVPYALKAGDAATVGGFPASAFVLATAANGGMPGTAMAGRADDPAAIPPPSSAVTGTGTVNYLPLWSSTSNILSSVLFESGSGSTAKIGINTTTPASTLDIKGGSTVRGTLSLPVTGNATATGGKNSQPLSLAASAFNSSSSAAVNQTFQWQAEPAANDTAAPSGTLDLLFGEGTAKPSETGLRIASNGQIVFASGQTFPGTGNGDGTITGVTAGTDLSGGGTSGNVTLNLNTGATDTRYAQLAAANTFSANQTVNGTINATSSVVTFTAHTSGFDAPAIYGVGSGSGGSGVAGFGSYIGVLGETNIGTGVEGFTEGDGTTYGVYGGGVSLSGFGVYGSTKFVGVYGSTYGGSLEGYGMGHAGVWGDGGGDSGTIAGVLGTADDSFAGYFNSAGPTYPTILVENGAANGAGGELFQGFVSGVNTYATIGDPGCNTGFMALQLGQTGMSGCSNYTLAGGTNGHTYVNASSGGAVHLRVNSVDVLQATSGNVSITGTLNATGTKNFRIDHPLDPANKYLVHAAIESSEVLNLYSGNVVLDGSGEAVVQLPEWFEVINKDFRYQLTPIAAPGRDLYIAEEVSGGHFTIAGGRPGGKVSWQVSGVRNDAWEKAHPLEVEVDKGADRGHYLTPELVGAPESERIGYMAPAPGSELVVHHPEARLKRGNASPPPRKLPNIVVPPVMPVVPKAVPLSHPPAPAWKKAVNQK